MGVKMLDSPTSVICREDMDSYLQEVLENGADVMVRLEKSLPYAVDGAIRKTIEDRIRDIEERKKALQGGFVPISLGYFARPDVTSKSREQDTKKAIDSMPEKAREVWKKAEAAGIFRSFTIIAAGSGGHFLIGKAGDKHFFITGWPGSK
jgi:hypothetical protein